jgi:hypothetical protein
VVKLTVERPGTAFRRYLPMSSAVKTPFNGIELFENACGKELL